jgi:hypothetical protein
VLRWLPVATNKAIDDMEQGEGTSPIKMVLRSKARFACAEKCSSCNNLLQHEGPLQ